MSNVCPVNPNGNHIFVKYEYSWWKCECGQVLDMSELED